MPAWQRPSRRRSCTTFIAGSAARPRHHRSPNGAPSLSGGQKQRIMLARALALEPKVLFLDDFTARVDAATETQDPGQCARRTIPGMTLISITQKIAPVEDYDQIILLMEGEVLATGTHEELMTPARIRPDPALAAKHRGLRSGVQDLTRSRPTPAQRSRLWARAWRRLAAADGGRGTQCRDRLRCHP